MGGYDTNNKQGGSSGVFKFLYQGCIFDLILSCHMASKLPESLPNTQFCTLFGCFSGNSQKNIKNIFNLFICLFQQTAKNGIAIFCINN